ncbi:MAG: hypothetical protein ABJC26_12645, partial [Gemmatimonadaceae bacterium]
MSRRFAAFAAVGFLMLDSSAASAQSCQTNAGNIVLNCSFELGTVHEGADYPNADVSSWTNSYAPQGGTFERWTNGFDGFFAQDGNSHIELQVNGPTYVQQLLGTTAGTSYSLSFWGAHRPRDEGGFSQIDVYVNGSYLTSTGQIFDAYQWHNYNSSFVGTGADVIEFRAMGNQLSYGDFLDNVT